MKETIYTIPINDAFDSDCSCPLCFIHNKLELELVEAAVGAGMMEPDNREISNEKGFCEKHIAMIHGQQKALPLALVLQSYIELQNKNIIKLLEESSHKKGVFKKTSKKEAAARAVSYIAEQQRKCTVCDHLYNQMQRYAENTVDMWKSMPEFKNKFNSNSTFCLEHFKLILDISSKRLNDKNFDEFFDIISQNQKASLASVYDNITEFVNSFDYRSSGQLSADARASTATAIKKFIGADI